MAGGCESHGVHHSCYFLATGAEQSLFLAQIGVMGKAKQRSRAAVRRIQAAVGVVPRPAARDREEGSET